MAMRRQSPMLTPLGGLGSHGNMMVPRGSPSIASTISKASPTSLALQRSLHTSTPRRQAGGPGGGAGGGGGGGFPGMGFPGMNFPGGQGKKPGETLKQYTTDLTQLARDGNLDPVIGRSDEIRRVSQILSRRTKSNSSLVGNAGVGKTAIIEGLAQRIVNKEVPASLQEKRILSLDLAAMMGGTGVRGELESRIKALLEDIEKEQGRVILFIDELHMLFSLGEGTAANYFKPMLARGQLQLIGATTYDEYRQTIEKDAALARRFQPVQVDEPSVDATIAILRGLRPRYELWHGVSIADSALVASASFASRYLSSERRLPDSAIDLVDEAMSACRLSQEAKPERLEMLERDVMTLQIELESLRKETDDISADRRSKVERQIADKKGVMDKLHQVWHEERAKLDRLKEIKAEKENVRVDLERAERERNFSLVAELRYGRLPELDRQQQQAEEALHRQAKKQEESGEEDEGLMIHDRVTAEDIAGVVSRQTGVPVRNLLRGERERLLHMEDALRNRVIGQDEALTAIAEAVRLSRAQLQNERRPLASFLFLGATGTGKTETAKALANFLFDSDKSLIQINLSEYSEPHTLSRLIGSPPGYVGSEDGGQLTEQVRRRPYSVILFDELEKAARPVQMALLQVLEEGNLTDSKGRNVSFKNAIVLATSNLGAEALYESNSTDSSGNLRPEAKRQVLQTVMANMAPELINRFDDQLVFNKLRKSDLTSIVELRLREVEARLAAQRVRISVDDEAKTWLADKGYDPVFGARPLNRVIRRNILNPLAKGLIANTIRPGDVLPIRLDKTKDELELQYLHQADDPPSPPHRSETADEQQQEGEATRQTRRSRRGRSRREDLDDFVDEADVDAHEDWKVVEPGGERP